MKDRRKFIKDLGRVAVLAGLAGIGVTLISRKKNGETGSCDYDFLCGNCKRRKSCRLPEAENFNGKNKKKGF